jgi:hypothetical protein
MTSRAKISSNRKNAKSSTGPSEEAKGWTRFNAVTHGMRSRTLLLPGEDPLALDALRETWVNRLKPRDPAEDELVSDYVNAVWLHRRADRALFRYLKAGIEQAAGREEENVAGDIRALFADAQGHHSLYAISTAACGGPTTSHPTDDATKGPDHPSTLVKRLESSEKGCLALTEYWKTLRDRALQGLEWQPQDRLKCIRMLGRQPLDVLDDQRILLIYIASFGLHPAGKRDPFGDFKCEMGTPELEPFVERVRTRWPLILDASNTPKAQQTLLDLVNRNIERLEAKVEVYRSLSAEGTASRSGPPASDSSIEADRLKRYEHASDRRAKRCLEAFYKFRREMGALEEDGGQRAEDGGDGLELKNAGDSQSESGVAGVESSVENTNLTSEANGASHASESADHKEVAALSEVLGRASILLSEIRGGGAGTFGTPVVGGAPGWAAIEEAIMASKPLLPPIS